MRIIFLLLLCAGYSQCITETLMQSGRVLDYQIGDTISIEHQLIEFDVQEDIA